MSCRRIVPLLDAFTDGELPAERTLEVEQHIAECEDCQERVTFQEAMRSSLRRAVRSDAGETDTLRARVALALAEERHSLATPASVPHRKPRHHDDHVIPHGRWASWSAGALAAAAAALLFARNQAESNGGTAASPPGAERVLAADTDVEALLDELVDFHSAPPSQTAPPTLSPELEAEVGVPVRAPSLVQYGAEWQGASVVPMRNRRAASFRYVVSGHRLTVYIYDADHVPLRGRLEPRVVANVPVYVGARRGYSIAAREQRGVGYAITTDLDDLQSAEIAASIH